MKFSRPPTIAEDVPPAKFPNVPGMRLSKPPPPTKAPGPAAWLNTPPLTVAKGAFVWMMLDKPPPMAAPSEFVWIVLSAPPPMTEKIELFEMVLLPPPPMALKSEPIWLAQTFTKPPNGEYLRVTIRAAAPDRRAYVAGRDHVNARAGDEIGSVTGFGFKPQCAGTVDFELQRLVVRSAEEVYAGRGAAIPDELPESGRIQTIQQIGIQVVDLGVAAYGEGRAGSRIEARRARHGEVSIKSGDITRKLGICDRARGAPRGNGVRCRRQLLPRAQGSRRAAGMKLNGDLQISCSPCERAGTEIQSGGDQSTAYWDIGSGIRIGAADQVAAGARRVIQRKRKIVEAV